MIKEYSVIKNEKRVLLCHSKSDNTIIRTYMEPITQEQESFLDKYIRKEYFTGFKNCENHYIDANSILSYGNVDLNSRADIACIKGLDILTDKGFIAYSSFDYDKGTVHTTGTEPNVILEYDSWNKVQHFKQCHCRINKAKKVIIYKEITPRTKKKN